MRLMFDPIKTNDAFLLYAKTFIPEIYKYAVSKTQLYEWANIHGNDVSNCILRVVSKDQKDPLIMSNNDFEYIMHHIIMNRHLDDYWLQSYLMKIL